jgi:hypothetical protein
MVIVNREQLFKPEQEDRKMDDNPKPAPVPPRRPPTQGNAPTQKKKIKTTEEEESKLPTPSEFVQHPRIPVGKDKAKKRRDSDDDMGL